MHPQAAYDELVRRSRDESLLASVANLLGWDEETYMPHGGAEHRANQLALLACLRHDRAIDPYIGGLLEDVENSELVADAESPVAVNVREWRRTYRRVKRLPRPLVEELARVTSLAQQEWFAARQDADYRRFLPWLEKIVALKREQGQAIGDTQSPYDALLDEYDPGLTSRDLAALLDEIRRAVTPLLAGIADSPRRPKAAILQRHYPIGRQQIFGEAAAAALGFDFQRGRLDTAQHPFTIGIGPGDCRLTTRFNPHFFSAGFFGILHEVGHGLYEQGLDPEHWGTPMGEVTSLGLHESQARLWENAVGRSRAFWRYFFPMLRQFFPDVLADVTEEDFYIAVNSVAPTCLRAQADEATYNLHILIRVELEQALLSGDLRAAELPPAWNESYRRHLHIVPVNDAEGCLQDGHWSAGLFGYFPAYTLGNLFAAQFFAAAGTALDDLDESMSRGQFGALLEWLTFKVYRHGHRYPVGALVERVAGSPPGPSALIQSLHRKYGELFDLPPDLAN